MAKNRERNFNFPVGRSSMNKHTLGAVAFFAISAVPALAADLPARTYNKAPAVTAAVYDWSGFYVGANGGWGSSSNCWDITNNVLAPGIPVGPVVPAAAEGCTSGSGAVGGGQIGYRWQTAGYVFGVEAQGDWASVKGSIFSVFAGGPLAGPPNVNSSTINGFGLLTGQVGYAIDNVLFYVKGGGAVTSNKYFGLVGPGGAAYDQVSETRWGGAVGAGFEYGFAYNWTVALEYDHLFMGANNVNLSSTGIFAPVGALSRTDSIGQSVDLVTVRVNYKFGGPVVARY
jgi:outer membrane immunogenic protein